ncbi:MAG: hypothetical protein IT325_05255, partial [Anaerolineae bacterium]|nr:hypothetical protein [Anaerolineae bacterium]
TFAGTGDGTLHRLRVAEEPAGFAVYGSCGDDSPKEETVFRLLAYERG